MNACFDDMQLQILLVDDSKSALAWTSDVLKVQGYGVVTFDDASKALKYFAQGSSDIVIADYEMPGMNGLEMMQDIHSLSPLTPVIFLSAHEEDAKLAVRLMRTGAVDFLTKTNDTRRLFGALSKAELLARQTRAMKRFVESGKQTEAALHRLNERLNSEIARQTSEISDREAQISAILDTAIDAIVSIDLSGRIETFNRAAEKMFGYKAPELYGCNVRCLMPLPYSQEHGLYLARYLQTGKTKIFGARRKIVARRKDHSIFPIDLAITEVDLEQRRSFTGFIRDISGQEVGNQVLQEYHALEDSNPCVARREPSV